MSIMSESTEYLRHGDRLQSSITPTSAVTLVGQERPLTILQRIDKAVLRLPPSFFSLNMGTGITSILLYNLPYSTIWLQRIGIAVFLLNIVIFCLLVLANCVRYIRWTGLFERVRCHSVSGMFWGCLPMGLATIVNMVAFACVPAWGRNWAIFALVLWWIDAVLSIGINFGMVYTIFTHPRAFDTMSAAWLLPIVASVVAAASGAVVAHALLPFDAELAKSTIVVAYVIWGTGVPLAMMIITLWIYRTSVHGVPQAIPSVFLPLGPCGQGAFGVVMLGKVVRELAYSYDIGIAVATSPNSILLLAEAFYAGGLVTGLVLWGLGLCFYTLAMALTFSHAIQKPSYLIPSNGNIGFTAYTFPIGVFATGTTILATELESPAFKVIGTILSLQVVFNWLWVMGIVCWKIRDGSIFVAPELEDGEPAERWHRSEIVKV